GRRPHQPRDTSRRGYGRAGADRDSSRGQGGWCAWRDAFIVAREVRKNRLDLPMREGRSARAGSTMGKNSATAKKGQRLDVDCDYARELRRLQVELVKLQEWVRHEGLKVAGIFEGRDAAGKG